MTRNYLLLIFLVGLFSSAYSQEYLFPMNHDFNWRIAQALEGDSNHFHTSMKPYHMDELRKVILVDTLISCELKSSKFYSTWGGRKLRKEHLLEVNKDDLHLTLDPIFNFEAGKDFETDRSNFVNTRGLFIQAKMGKKFYAYTGFYENQARYVSYVNDQIKDNGVVPGQGRVKFLENEVVDFNSAFGGIGFTPSKHFDLQLAQDKNFIGEGYRSLLLSDNTFSYPFIRITAKFWRIQYMVLYNMMQDLQLPYDQDEGFQRKYSTVHYFSINVGKRERLSFGLFESLIWKGDSLRGFDFSYLNPVIFLRPVENANGSPDNELLGGTIKYRVNAHHVLYGQLMLDELLIDSIKAGNGWWGNKQAFQVGYKGFSLFGVKELNLQTEFNFVRPFVYAHRSRLQNYAHYNQALAHPLGANFIESVSFLNYRWKNLFLQVKFMYAETGLDTTDVNHGQNIFKDYDTRTSESGNYILDGINTTIVHSGLQISYLVNPKTNFIVKAGIDNRRFNNILKKENTQFVYFGISTALNNFYFDF